MKVTDLIPGRSYSVNECHMCGKRDYYEVPSSHGEWWREFKVYGGWYQLCPGCERRVARFIEESAKVVAGGEEE